MMALFHLDSHFTCRVPLTGMKPFDRVGKMASAIIRVPIHVVVQTIGPSGETVSGRSESEQQDDYDQWEGNPGSTIIEWRTLLVVAFGCAPTAAKPAHNHRVLP